MYKLVLIIIALHLSLYTKAQNASSSCTDGVKNGREIDIDCGGACDLCEDGLQTGQMITVDEAESYQYKHAIWLPPGYDETNEYRDMPLIVFLHGNGQLGGNTTQIQNYGPMKYRNESWWDYPFIIVNPVRDENVVGEELTGFIDQIIDEYHVDESRVYLTGLSGGSFGIASYVDLLPDGMAAIVSIAGYMPFINTRCTEFKGTPIWYFHDIGDPTVSFSYATIDEFGTLHESCGDPQPDPYISLSIFDGSSHNSWSRVYDPYLNADNASTYSSQYNLADISYVTADVAWDDIDYDIYQTLFGIPNNVEPIYDWFLNYENILNSCRNQVQDNDETGVDCGGSCKPCTTTYNCHNGVLDAGETDIDCGGDCPVCERDVIWKSTSWNNTDGPISTDNAIVLEDFSGSMSCKDLIIAKGATFIVDGTLEVKEDLINNGTLIISSGSSIITYEGGTVSDNIIVRRNTRYADGKYSFVGTPVESNSAMTTSDLGEFVYTYDESTSAVVDDLVRWISAIGNDMLMPGTGYTQAYQQLLEFIGRPNSGTITYPAGYVNDGWHLVSNPYASAIFLDDFIAVNGNTTGAIYIWDDNDSQTSRGNSGDYIIVNLTAAIDLSGRGNASRWNGYIGSSQGFFVQLSGSAGDITFNESMRVSGNNSDDNFFRKKENNPLLRINLASPSGVVKQTVIGWNSNVSDYEITSGFDAPVFNPNANYNLYSFKSGEPLAIQTITESKPEVQLGYYAEESGVYAMAFALENQNDSYYLIDKLEQTRTRIFDQASYSFSSSVGQFDERFTVVKESIILSLEEEKVMVYTSEKTLYILSDDREGQYWIYNVQGRLLKDISTNGSVNIDLSHLSNGVYLISNGLSTKKVILE